jgi:hypothetical protein
VASDYGSGYGLGAVGGGVAAVGSGTLCQADPQAIAYCREHTQSAIRARRATTSAVTIGMLDSG